MDMPNPTGSRKGSLALKIIGGIVAGIIIIVFIIMLATSGIEIVKVVENQLDFLKAGDYRAAYDLTSNDFRASISLENFTAYVNQYPVLSKNAEHSFNERSIEDNEGTIKGTLKSEDGTVNTIAYTLIKENDVWRIHMIEIGEVSEE